MTGAGCPIKNRFITFSHNSLHFMHQIFYQDKAASVGNQRSYSWKKYKGADFLNSLSGSPQATKLN
jgi:hypothetical protein